MKETSFFFIYNSRLLYSVCELGTSLELSNLLGSNLNLLLGSGVDTLACGLLGNSECTETYQLNLVTLLQSICDSCYSSVKSLLCVNLCQTSTCCNLLN